MATGRPDWYGTQVITGKYGDNFLPVLVGADGKMYVLMTGADGNLIAVDADGFITAKMKGLKSPGVYGDIAVDEDGNLRAVFKGSFDDELKTVAVDTDGLLLTNISRQGLEYLKVRPVYGEAVRASGSVVVGSGIGYVDLASVAGQGGIYGGMISWTGGTGDQGQIGLFADGNDISAFVISYLNTRSVDGKTDSLLYVIRYDPVGTYYAMGIKKGITFETSFEVKALNTSGGNITFYYWLYYALVP